MITVLHMYMYHLSIHYMELLLEMSGFIDANYELFNKSNLSLTGYVGIVN